MKCREVKRLMYLYREKEIPEETRREILQHTGSCRRCEQELRQAGSTGLFIAGLRSIEPRLQARRDLTGEVMRGIESNQELTLRCGPGLAVPSFHRLQVACTLAAAAIVCVFFIQNLFDVYRVADLESRLHQSPSALMASPAAPSLATLGMSTIREIGRSLSQSPAPTGERLHGLLQMREAVRTFFYVLEEGSPVFAAEVQRLRAKYPEVWLISPLNGLTQRERLVLSQQGKLVLRDLRKVLHPGGSNYEN